MGMSPSCHCICPGTGDVGSYSSQSADTIACTHCAVAARRWSVTFTHPSATSAACCCSSYTGAFTLTHIGGTACTWVSDELVLCCRRDSGGNTCVAGSSGDRRMTYTITKSGVTFTQKATFQYEYREFFTGTRHKCSMEFTSTGTTLECLSTKTLTFSGRVQVDLGIVACGGDTANGGPCTEAVPSGADPYAGLTCSLVAVL